MDPRAVEQFRNIQASFTQGGEIPAFSLESQNRLRTRLNTCESRLNQLFTSSIHPERVDITLRSEFLPTPDFFEQAILEGKPLPTDFKELIGLITDTLDIRGMRSFDGKRVMVHTVIYEPNKTPRQMSEEEAFIIARHELTHGKVEPVVVDRGSDKQERRTGCKVVSLVKGKVTNTYHTATYEAQTDAIAVYSSHPEVTSWNDIFQIYLKEKTEINLDYENGLAALCKLMDFAFPDFQEGMTMMGVSYFQSRDNLFITIEEKLRARGIETHANSPFDNFFDYSCFNRSKGMHEAVNQLIAPTKPAQ